MRTRWRWLQATRTMADPGMGSGMAPSTGSRGPARLARLLLVAALALWVTIALLITALWVVTQVRPGLAVPRGTAYGLLLFAFLASGGVTAILARRWGPAKGRPTEVTASTLALVSTCVVLGYAVSGTVVSLWDFGQASDWLSASAYLKYIGLWLVWIAGGLAPPLGRRLWDGWSRLSLRH
jgi:hypothetical protein